MDDDTFQASVDLDYLNSSTPKVPTGETQHPLVAKPVWERIWKKKKKM